jgi:transposase-like protein
MSDRKVSEYFSTLYGERILSAQGVSDLYERLTRDVARWHRRKLLDDYVYLYLDGMVQGIKEGVRKQKTVLVAFGIKANGSKEVIDYTIAMGESAGAWARFLEGLRERGLSGEKLELIIHDGCSGLKDALKWIWPQVKTQLCCIHHMRNLSRRIPSVHMRARIMKDAAQIYESNSKQEACERAAVFKKRWAWYAPKAIGRFLTQIEETLVYYEFPKELWAKLKSTNPIERYLEEWRRRLRTMRCLKNIASCDRILFGQVMEYNVKQNGFTLKSELCLT